MRATLPIPRSSVAAVTDDRPADLVSQDRYAALLGMRLVDATTESVTVEMTVTSDHLNFLGVTHGGAVFSLADCAMSLACNGGPDRWVAIDTHLVISSPSAEGDVLRAVVTRATGGRRLGTYQATVTRGDGRVVGLFTGTVLKA